MKTLIKRYEKRLKNIRSDLVSNMKNENAEPTARLLLIERSRCFEQFLSDLKKFDEEQTDIKDVN